MRCVSPIMLTRQRQILAGLTLMLVSFAAAMAFGVNQHNISNVDDITHVSCVLSSWGCFLLKLDCRILLPSSMNGKSKYPGLNLPQKCTRTPCFVSVSLVALLQPMLSVGAGSHHTVFTAPKQGSYLFE